MIARQDRFVIPRAICQFNNSIAKDLDLNCDLKARVIVSGLVQRAQTSFIWAERRVRPALRLSTALLPADKTA